MAHQNGSPEWLTRTARLKLRNLLFFAALAPLAVYAADTDVPAPAETLDSSLAGDIVVTATRNAQSAFDTPVSISRIGGDDFSQIGAKHQADLLNQVPGAYVQRGSGSESLVAIRSPVLAGAGACGSFLVAEDSLPIRPVGFCNLNEMFEVNYEQARTVEVLRGPGSALFGASAVHGIVNLITPDHEQIPGLFLSAEGGSDSFKRLGFGTSFGSGLGAYGVATRAPGWRDASGVDELKLNLLSDTSIGPGELKLRAAGTVLNQETAGFIQGFGAYRDEALARSNPNPEAFRDASSARVSFHYSTDSLYDDQGYFEVGGIYRRSRMDFSQHFLIGKPLEHNAQTSYLLNGAMFFHRGHWRARIALDAETAATELTEFQPAPATDGAPAANAVRPAGYHYNYTVASDTVGATASVEYEFAEDWHATAALRADTTSYDYDNRMLDGNTDQNGVSCGATGCLYARPADRKDRFDNVSPRLTLAWDTGASNLYLTGSTGYRPPEMTELYRLQRQQTLANLDSEQLDSVELGWKANGALLDWELALFAMRKQNVILRESNGFNVGNGSTRHRGLEYRVACDECGPPEKAFTLAFTGTVARHEYSFSRAVEGGESIVSGNDIDTAPRNLHSIDVSYPARVYTRDWQVGATWNHVGSYFLDAANTAKYPGHQVVDLRLAWRPLEHIHLTLRIDNLFDTAYADRADFAFGNYRYFPARGRAAFLAIDYKSD
jgi:iron complex outermembrane recepter protein